MKNQEIKNIVFLLITFLVISQSFALSVNKESKNVLILNSYHRGYMWTDSVTIGTIRGLKAAGSINYFVHYLNSKHFGQSNFETEKKYLKEKYEAVEFDGLLVLDNDALEFALKYNDELFAGLPIVFSGISNPENYNIIDREIYGVLENSGSDKIIEFITRILPNIKRLFVTVDKSTTGQIAREKIISNSDNYPGLEIIFPESVEADSILGYVSSSTNIDAIYYLSMNAQRDGSLIDFSDFGQEIIVNSNVPVFTSSPIFIGKGALAGAYQSGKLHGREAGKLMAQILDSTKEKPKVKYYSTHVNYFFDNKLLKKYNINKSNLPEGTFIYNSTDEINKYYLISSITVLLFLLSIVFYLVYSNIRYKKAREKIHMQFLEIQSQNKKLSIANENLNTLMSKIEQTNNDLKSANLNLFEAKKKAEESDNLKSAFLANVSHEIRTPLNSIVGFSSLLAEEELDAEMKKEYSNLIESNNESLLVLINEILDLSKIEANQLVLYNERFSIKELLSELLLSFSGINKNSRVTLNYINSNKNIELYAFSDRYRLKQVFTNLISNALKFTDEGSVEFGYSLNEQNDVVFFVKDSGIGISQENHEIIFERFLKLNDKTGKIYRGTGLGLSICKKLIEMLGGSIWVDSVKNVGSTFSFTLNGVLFSETNHLKN